MLVIDDTISTGTLRRLVPDITERQLHYWRVIGAIEPSSGGSAPGSGRRVRWSRRDVQRLQAIARFQRAVAPFVSNMSTDGVRAIWRGLAFDDAVELGDDVVRITVTIEGDP